jgi:hypothetical protein
MFNAGANFRSLLDDPKLAEKTAAARELVAQLVPAEPRTTTQIQDDAAKLAKSASQITNEIADHIALTRAERDVKVACVVHIASVCERLLAG